jgi:hypothetical protein
LAGFWAAGLETGVGLAAGLLAFTAGVVALKAGFFAGDLVCGFTAFFTGLGAGFLAGAFIGFFAAGLAGFALLAFTAGLAFLISTVFLTGFAGALALLLTDLAVAFLAIFFFAGITGDALRWSQHRFHTSTHIA